MQDTKTINLEKSLIVGTKDDGSFNEITKITFREPTAGDLRGLSLKSLLADTRADDWMTLLSRVSFPSVSKEVLSMMNIKDFTNCVAAIMEILGDEKKPEDIQKN